MIVKSRRFSRFDEPGVEPLRRLRTMFLDVSDSRQQFSFSAALPVREWSLRLRRPRPGFGVFPCDHPVVRSRRATSTGRPDADTARQPQSERKQSFAGVA